MNDACVAIRTKNEASNIRKVLNQVFRQEGVRFDVIVVDSGSRDDTLKIVSEFPCKVIEINPEEFSYGRALNLAYANSNSIYCVALSAHAPPLDRHWLRNILMPFEDQSVCAVVGKQMPREDCNPFDAGGLKRIYGTEKLYLTRDSRITFSNANAAVRRSDWETLRFDEGLSYSEDLHWSYQMLRKGRRIVYEPTAAVFHGHNESPRRLYERFYNESYARQSLRYGRGRYGAMRLFIDATAGTAFDMTTAVKRPGKIKWLFYAPVRRVAVNLGRYCGSRMLPRDPKVGPGRQILLRMGLMFLEKTNRTLQALAPYLVKATRKHISAVHPKHLLSDDAAHYWYEQYLKPDSLVLDIGCNQGMHTIFASRFAKFVVGMEIDKEAVYVADFNSKWERRKNVRFVLGDAARIPPFRDRSFDTIMAFDIIEHLPDRSGFLQRMRRLLKPGGVLLLSAPNSRTRFKKLKRLAGLPTYSDPTHVVEYTLDELQEECRRNGFETRNPAPVTLDSPFYGIIDFVGGLSLSLYEFLDRRKRRLAKENPANSTGFRLCCEPVENQDG